jgi:hypothetical protein
MNTRPSYYYYFAREQHSQSLRSPARVWEAIGPSDGRSDVIPKWALEAEIVKILSKMVAHSDAHNLSTVQYSFGIDCA